MKHSLWAYAQITRLLWYCIWFTQNQSNIRWVYIIEPFMLHCVFTQDLAALSLFRSCFNSPFITCLSITGDWLQWVSRSVTVLDDSLWEYGWSDRSQARYSQLHCRSKYQSSVQTEETLEEPPAIYRRKQRNTEGCITICMPILSQL